MYKVMIVDDEVLVRVGLKTTIDWEAIGFTIVSEAANGEQAYENYLKSRPEVIITDIKMPKQDGLWLVEQIRKEDSDAQILVLTCYDEFSYVRKAIRTGANDYILKSEIEDEELIKLMLSLKEKLDTQSKTDMEQENKPTTEEHKLAVAAELLKKGFHLEEKQLKALKTLNFPVTDTSYAFISLSVNYNGDTKTDISQVDYAVLNILFEQFNLNGIAHIDIVHTDIAQSHRYLIFISSKDLKAAEIKRTFSAAASGALQYFNVSLNGIYSQVFYEAEQAGRIYNTFSDKTQALFYTMKDNHLIIPADTINFEEPSVSELKNLYNKNFIEAIGLENLDRVKELLEEKERYFKSTTVSPMIVKIFYSNLLGDIFGSYGLYLAESPEFETHKSYHYKIEQADRLSDINKLFLDFSEKLIRQIQEIRYNNSRFLINQALNFINYHYTEKISLDDVAMELSVSKHYLSSVFKKETGENMSIYINKLRIEKAKRLLLESDIKIKEIFEKVGYSDQQYFSKVFKKITGKTVVEYKEGVGNK
ncbi:response regulator [Anaerocolumna sp. AGMB13025]|uniref:response regulator transcription factor n=1 Tax=Anaerocolumna sp. AGMB13025 TaxID=3039116 RepID=UPI00241E4161|nr:response regulator [Anaerocolumna sp. AGMB13025]WFR55520.1 response regulator [Anaerocolumna sp. AGMB13025]